MKGLIVALKNYQHWSHALPSITDTQLRFLASFAGCSERLSTSYSVSSKDCQLVYRVISPNCRIIKRFISGNKWCYWKKKISHCCKFMDVYFLMKKNFKSVSIGVHAHIAHHMEICHQFPFLFPNSCYEKRYIHCNLLIFG